MSTAALHISLDEPQRSRDLATLARQAHRGQVAGSRVICLPPLDRRGRHSIAPDAVATTLRTLDQYNVEGEIWFDIDTGEPPERRRTAISLWARTPAAVEIGMDDQHGAALARSVAELGVPVAIRVTEPAQVRALVDHIPLRAVVVEPRSQESLPAVLRSMRACLDIRSPDTEGVVAVNDWGLAREVIAAGLGLRLSRTLLPVLPDGRPVTDVAQLASRAVQLIDYLGALRP